MQNQKSILNHGTKKSQQASSSSSFSAKKRTNSPLREDSFKTSKLTNTNNETTISSSTLVKEKKLTKTVSPTSKKASKKADSSPLKKRVRLSPEERKAFIQDIAKELFLKKGFSNTTMEDICKATNMSKGGLYYYYKDTISIFYDLMKFGNEIFYRKSLQVMKNNAHRGLFDVFLQMVLQKFIVDKENERYRDLFYMFLEQSQYNQKMNELKVMIIAKGKERLHDLLNSAGLPFFNFIFTDFYVDFVHSLISSANFMLKGQSEDYVANYHKKLEEILGVIFEREIRNAGYGEYLDNKDSILYQPIKDTPLYKAFQEKDCLQY